MITDEEVEARLESRKLSPFINRADRNTARTVIENRLRRKQKDFESVRDFLEELQIAKEEPEKEKELNKNCEWIFEKQELICVICLENKIEVINLPCGHFKTCKMCSNKMKLCPICRQTIERRVLNVQLQKLLKYESRHVKCK